MTRLMSGDGQFLLVGDNARFLLETADYAVDGRHEIVPIDGILIVARGDKSRLVADIGNVCT